MKSDYRLDCRRNRTWWRLNRSIAVVAGVLWSFLITGRSTYAAEGQRLDVNDVSILWPMPDSMEGVENLIALDSPASDGDIVPDAVFTKLMAEAQTVEVSGSKISFPVGVANQRHAWKVVGIRVNPSALGTNPAVLAQAGTVPGIRLVVQPVIMNNGKVVVHDFAAHVVFNYLANAQPPFQPDKAAFGAVVKDLQELKEFLRAAGVVTESAKLGVHPGLAAKVPGLNDRLKALLKKHLNRQRLQVISFMGIPGGFEPWIFFKVHVGPGDVLVRQNVSGHFGPASPTSQMLAFVGSKRVDPATVLDAQAAKEGFGISTAILFASDIDTRLDETLLPEATALPQQQWKLRDVADLIANPFIHNTSNTDCVSCHTESTRRKLIPNLKSQEGITFKLPAGISGVDENLLPVDKWNVRDFGWGFNFTTNKGFHPTITQRAANEAAESADFINREYIQTLGSGAN